MPVAGYVTGDAETARHETARKESAAQKCFVVVVFFPARYKYSYLLTYLLSSLPLNYQLFAYVGRP